VASSVHRNEKSTSPEIDAKFALVAYMGIEISFKHFNMTL
jgi:hypothetical protein